MGVGRGSPVKLTSCYGGREASVVATAFDKLVELVRALNQHGVAYVLFGGQAVNLQGVPRFTEDIDLFVNQDDE